MGLLVCGVPDHFYTALWVGRSDGAFSVWSS